jgi:hypothetical protein
VPNVPWSIFCAYPDSRPKFDDAWLLNPANVVTPFSSKPGQYCRLCDSYFAGVAAEHVADHAPSLAAWRQKQKPARPVAKKQPAHVTAEPEQSDFPPNHAGRNGQDGCEKAARDALYVCADSDLKTPHTPRPKKGQMWTDEHRRKSHSPTAHERRRNTFKSKTDARRAEIWSLYAEGLVPMAIADRPGISDRSVRRYLSSPALQDTFYDS